MDIHLKEHNKIDYYTLNSLLSRNNKKPISILDFESQQKAVSLGRISEETLVAMKREIGRRVSYKNYTSKLTYTKSGGITWCLTPIIEAGLYHRKDSTIVKIDLMHSVINLLAIISGVDLDNHEYIETNINSLVPWLRPIVTGEFRDEDFAYSCLSRVIEYENWYLNAYLTKCIALSQSKNIYIMDMFGNTKRYKELFPLEVFSMPITQSLNILQYAVVDAIDKQFKRNDVAFLCVDNYSIYYQVENHILESFVDTEFHFRGDKLNFAKSFIQPCL